MSKNDTHEPQNKANEPQNNTDIINSVDSNGGQKTRESLLNLIATNSKITSTQMAENLGINRSAVSKHLKNYKKETSSNAKAPTKADNGLL